jgi:hypothetical protein
MIDGAEGGIGAARESGGNDEHEGKASHFVVYSLAGSVPSSRKMAPLRTTWNIWEFQKF